MPTAPNLSLGGGSGSSLPSTIKYPQLHAAIATVNAGGAAPDRKLLMIGDSITAGALTGALMKGPGKTLIQVLKSFMPCNYGLVGAPENTAAGSDSRFSLGSGWTMPASGVPGTAGAHNGWAGLGGAYNGAASAAGTLVYTTDTPGASYDHFDVYSLNLGVLQGFSVNFNGGSNTVVSGSAAGVIKTTVSGAVTGSPVFCIMSAPTGFGCYIIGVEPYLSTTTTMRVGNVGQFGATSSNWTDNTNPATGPLACIAAYAPNIVLIGVGGGDLTSGGSLSTYLANMTTLIQFCQGLGAAVVLWTEVPFAPTGTAGAAGSPAQWAALASLASQLGCGFIDTFNAWGGNAGFATLNGLNYYADALIHPSALGDGDLGRLLAQGIVSL